MAHKTWQDIYSCFDERKQEILWIFDVERKMSQLEKRQKMAKIYIFKALTSIFWLTSKLIRRMKKQESCLWRPNGLHEKVIICY